MAMESSQIQLTSTTAPGKVFATRADLASHYKSEWHRYNLKRREAGLPVLLEADFQARLDAAKALRQEKVVGKDHLKRGKKDAKKKQKAAAAAVGAERMKEQEKQATAAKGAQSMETEAATEDGPSNQQIEEEEAIEIEPRQCLFDKHMSKSVVANVDRMHRKYGFFVPDREYVTDLEGFVGFCHEKIKLGHMCLYCQRTFTTWQGCQKHMISKEHGKIRYEHGVDLADFSVFYDFAEADAVFLGRPRAGEGEGMAMVDEDDAEAEGDNGEWEDISDDEMEADGEDADADVDMQDDDDLYAGYQDEVSRMGFDVTPLGELVFPDGRIVGHRSLRRYYKQRAAPTNDSTAVVAARNAAGERVWRGQVFNINQPPTAAEENLLALSQAGIAPGYAAGRAGKGILVKQGPSGTFSQLSVYRYRAAIRKQRRGDEQGQRLANRTLLNMNRMDKKANRLFNDVSVAWAKR